ncbi:MAG: alpha-amylase [Mogibacterium sp.]|nr:alpha-amylase [Mogibacterium sp.]
MAWYEEAVFYHIYPLGLLGAPEENNYGEPVHRLPELKEWVSHMKTIGADALYLGPCFSSGSHGYDTTDYRRLDERLGTNEDLADLVGFCHENGVRVILDGVFNHTGRDFFAFRDLKAYRENSRYREWYCDVNFMGNNEYGDGFSYQNWGGYNLLPKLNLYNPEVREYLYDTIRFWVREFDIDGLRLDAADVLEHNFMRGLRGLANDLANGSKKDFWLMGEVIHGDYSRWVNENTLHSVTNYALHKALYSAHNDHNYFEIAHTIRRQEQMGLGGNVHLYNFTDNHDVERIMTKLNNKRHFLPVHVLLYTLPGIPSVYYGSEFGIEGKKMRGSDASLRPYLSLSELTAERKAPLEIMQALGHIHREESALWYGDYRELELTTTKYAYARGDLLVTVTNSDAEEHFDLPASGTYKGALTGREIKEDQGRLRFSLEGNSGEIWIPAGEKKQYEPVRTVIEVRDTSHDETSTADFAPERAKGKSYEEMSIEELQAEILAKLAANGPVTDRMKQDVRENVYRDSLLNWVKSFR